MLPQYLLVFLISMVPLIELRGAIPIALGMGLPTLPAYIVCVIGNMLPVPVIYFFARKVLVWGADKKFIGKFFTFCLEKGNKAGQKLVAAAGRGGLFVALMLFVGIPLPGTGAWTSSWASSAPWACTFSDYNWEVITMSNCLFCKIIEGSIPSTKVYEDDLVLAFRDINPMAPTHILVIPKVHIGSVDGVTAENSHVVAHIFAVIPEIAKAEKLDHGYRVVSNCGEHAGQTVPHLHFHILGGKQLALEMA